MNKERIVFCLIAWMKKFQGINDNDIPRNGGSFVKENNDCCEGTNFLDFNHKCYGFIQNKGNSLHIERVDQDYINKDFIEGVTVIWVATDGKACKIVGWYKNAIMYRNYKNTIGSIQNYDYLQYNFEADVKDCYLIPEEDRNFVVPRASKNGKGRGMGRSNIWYAESSYAKSELIPNVLDYIDNYKGKFVDIEITNEKLTQVAKDIGLSVDELINKTYGYNENPVDDIAYLNLAIKKEYSFKTLFERANHLEYLGAYDEAIKQYKKALYEDKDDVDCLFKLMDLHYFKKDFFLAIEYGKKLLDLLEDGEDKYDVMINLIDLYVLDFQYEKAISSIREYEKLNTGYGKDIIDNIKYDLDVD